MIGTCLSVLTTLSVRFSVDEFSTRVAWTQVSEGASVWKGGILGAGGTHTFEGYL
jgi:hypothetical protein